MLLLDEMRVVFLRARVEGSVLWNKAGRLEDIFHGVRYANGKMRLGGGCIRMK